MKLLLRLQLCLPVRVCQGQALHLLSGKQKPDAQALLILKQTPPCIPAPPQAGGEGKPQAAGG